jgi:hypothetical protein
MSDPHVLAVELNTNDASLEQSLAEIIAELRDRGITPRPLNVLRYALGLGMSEQVAADLATLLERRFEMGGSA